MWRGTWCQDVRHQSGDVAGPHTYQYLMYVAPLHGLVHWWYGPCTLGPINLRGRVYLNGRSGGIEQDLIPYVKQHVFANVPIERLINDPSGHSFFNGASDGM